MNGDPQVDRNWLYMTEMCNTQQCWIVNYNDNYN